ncbi:MAG: phosphoglucomutase/phosphomannomutase family protein [Candidatus Bipolaricaulia bacterium]
MSAVGEIHFGTDGWRGVIAEDFTFANVGRVARAIADYLKSPDRKKASIYTEWGSEYRPATSGVVIGYDTRFLSEAFAAQVGTVLMDEEIPAYLSAEPIPTPALSYAVEDRRAAAGVMITASHNPPQYNGLKIKAEFASSVPPEVTAAIERRIPRRFSAPQHRPDQLKRVDLKTPYLKRLGELIDRERIRSAPLHVVIDAMYGSARGCIADVLDEIGVSYVEIRTANNPYFGRGHPEPLARNLVPLKAVIASERRRQQTGEILIGLATDGDGDRVAGMDENGVLIDSHRCYALIFKHLVEARGWTGKAVKSFALTDMANRIAAQHRVTVHEVPIGFKYVSELFLKDDILIGGEESGGIGIKDHIPDRDGALMALLLLEITAVHRCPMSEIIDKMMQGIGYHYYERRDLHLDHVEDRDRVVARLTQRPPDQFADRRLRTIEDLDGIKLRFDDGWLLFRPSGTEPVLRLYTEMNAPDKLGEVLDAAERYARGDLRLW